MKLQIILIVIHTLARVARERIQRSIRALRGEPRRLRVGVDIRPFYEPLTGVGWYLHSLLEELAKRDDIELVLFGDARLTDLGPRLHVALPDGLRPAWFDLRGFPPSSFGRRVTAAAYLLWIRLEACDVMFGANYFLPRLLSATARRRVITVHDLTYRRFPELLQKETLANLQREMPRELAHANAIISVSESTRRDLLHDYAIDPARVVAIHSGVPQHKPLPKERATNLPVRYILFVSTIEPRKDLVTLIDAFERLKASGKYEGALIVVGKIGWKAESAVLRMKMSAVKADIHHLDYVDRERLGAIYANADLFVFPSLYEGFGFPLLEAMAHGVPAIAARSSSLPEVGGDAAIYFEPGNAAQLTTEIDRVLSDDRLRQSLVERGHAQVAKFTWSKSAEETMRVFRRVTSE